MKRVRVRPVTAPGRCVPGDRLHQPGELATVQKPGSVQARRRLPGDFGGGHLRSQLCGAERPYLRAGNNNPPATFNDNIQRVLDDGVEPLDISIEVGFPQPSCQSVGQDSLSWSNSPSL
jgi:hypothetical protein